MSEPVHGTQSHAAVEQCRCGVSAGFSTGWHAVGTNDCPFSWILPGECGKGVVRSNGLSSTVHFYCLSHCHLQGNHLEGQPQLLAACAHKPCYGCHHGCAVFNLTAVLCAQGCTQGAFIMSVQCGCRNWGHHTNTVACCVPLLNMIRGMQFWLCTAFAAAPLVQQGCDCTPTYNPSCPVAWGMASVDVSLVWCACTPLQTFVRLGWL